MKRVKVFRGEAVTAVAAFCAAVFAVILGSTTYPGTTHDCGCRPCDACIERGLRKQKKLDDSELQRVQDAVGYSNTTDKLRTENERLRAEVEESWKQRVRAERERNDLRVENSLLHRKLHDATELPHDPGDNG
jgi:hypothetical protein